MGCMVSQPFTARGNWSYPDFWAVTGDSWYPGYKTLKVAPEPSVEQVAEAVYLTGGKIGTDIILWVSPRDLVVRPWGQSLHGHDLESHSGSHHVAPEAAVELKAQTEAKFHMYYFFELTT
jgi:hypothetical protein